MFCVTSCFVCTWSGSAARPSSAWVSRGPGPLTRQPPAHGALGDAEIGAKPALPAASARARAMWGSRLGGVAASPLLARPWRLPPHCCGQAPVSRPAPDEQPQIATPAGAASAHTPRPSDPRPDKAAQARRSRAIFSRRMQGAASGPASPRPALICRLCPLGLVARLRYMAPGCPARARKGTSSQASQVWRVRVNDSERRRSADRPAPGESQGARSPAMTRAGVLRSAR
jgi:hypothetical protein